MCESKISLENTDQNDGYGKRDLGDTRRGI